MKYVGAILVLAIGVAAVIGGGYDDSPGGQFIGVVLIIVAIVLGVRTLKADQAQRRSSA